MLHYWRRYASLRLNYRWLDCLIGTFKRTPPTIRPDDYGVMKLTAGPHAVERLKISPTVAGR